MVATALILTPWGARALGVAGTDAAPARVRSADVVVWRDGDREALVETIVVEPGDGPVAILRAFPAPPSEIVKLDLAALTDLRDSAVALAPLQTRVRARLFGPSIMTPILAPLLREEQGPAQAPIPTARLDVDLEALAQFKGPTTTSSVTLQRFLPPALEAWLTKGEVALSAAQRDLTARALDRGWTVVAALAERPTRDAPITIGPWLYRFASAELVIPPCIGSGNQAPPLTVYAIDEEPLGPEGRALTWNEKPWAPGSKPAGADTVPAPLNVSYWGARDGAATFRLQAVMGERAPGRVLRGTLQEVGLPVSELVLRPVQGAKPIPARGGHGSGLDLLLCALLGLAPLLYAPESWILLWAAANARAERGRGEPVGLAGALWPLYALVVALFWVVTLPGAARVAAAGPLLIGLYRLFAGAPERERGPVRVDFRRKLKPADKNAKAPAGASKPPEESKAPAGASKPPAGASKPPAGASKPPAGSEKAPASASKQPAGSSKPPAGPSKQPAGSSKPPAGPSKQPAGSSKPPAGPSKQPAGSEKAPAGPSKQPAGSSKPPADAK